MTEHNDWRQMRPGLTLDWLIAEKVGWRIEGIPPPPDKQGEHWYRVIDAQGLERPYLSGWPRPGGWPEYELDMILPPYSTDLIAALTLLDTLPDGWGWYIDRSNDHPRRYTVNISHDSRGPEDDDWLEAETLDELPYKICHLWLEWMDKNPAKRTFGSAPGVWMSEDFEESEDK